MEFNPTRGLKRDSAECASEFPPPGDKETGAFYLIHLWLRFALKSMFRRGWSMFQWSTGCLHTTHHIYFQEATFSSWRIWAWCLQPHLLHTLCSMELTRGKGTMDPLNSFDVIRENEDRNFFFFFTIGTKHVLIYASSTFFSKIVILYCNKKISLMIWR